MSMPESSSLSSLQRSKTAPTPLVDSPGASATRWGGRQLNDRINRSKTSCIGKPKTSAHAHLDGKYTDRGTFGAAIWGLDLALDGVGVAQTSPPLVSPRHDVVDDPFNLADFFPSRPGSYEHPVEWAWRSPAEETESEAEEESERESERDYSDAGRSSLPPTRSLSMNALDEYAREIIAKESKLGILGLARVPSFLKSISEVYFGQAEEDQQRLPHAHAPQLETVFEISSAAIDEPFDADSLSESMHARRVKSERDLSLVTGSDLKRVPSLGLFSPPTEMRDAELGWASALYTKILGPGGVVM